MKRFFVLLAVFAIVCAGAAYAADQSGAAATSTSQPDTQPVATGQADDDNVPVVIPTQTDTQPAVSPYQPAQEEEPSEKPKKKGVPLGLMIGIFSPTDSQVKDLYGSSWIRYGLRPLPINIEQKWRPTIDVSYYTMSHSGNKVKLIPITFGFTRGFGNDKNVKHYISAHAGGYYGDLDAPAIGVSDNGWGFNANATYGIVLNDRLSLEVRYEMFDKLGGLDFNALTYSLALRLPKVRF